MDAIAQAAYEGNAETLAQLVEGVRLPNDFALGVAASAGHVECVRILIPVSPIHIKKSMAFRWAAQNNHIACVQELLPFSTFSSRTKALKAACVFHNQDLIDLLAPISDVQRVSKEFASKGLQTQQELLKPYL